MAKGASRSAANHVVKENCSVDVDPSVPISSEQGKQTDSDVIAEVSEVNEKHLSSRVRALPKRRKRKHEISSESIKKPKKILSDSSLEQQTGNNTTSNTVHSQDKFPLAHAQTASEKDELLGNAKGHSSCEVKNTVEKTDVDKIVDASTVSEKQLGKRVLAQRARREREKQELQLKKLCVSHDQTEQHLPFAPIPPNTALEQQTSDAPSNTACSQEIVNKCPSNVELTPTRMYTEKDEFLMKKKDHSCCEVKNVVEKTDTDKIVDVSTVTERHLRKCVLAPRARREREKKELQLKKLCVSSSAVKTRVTRDQTEQHLPFSPIPSNSALELQTSNAPSNTACSQETINKCPSNIALTPTQTDTEKDELLVKKKDHSCCEVKNAVEKTDTGKIVDTTTVTEKHLRQCVLALRARTETEKKEHQLKKLSMSSSTVKNMVTCDQTKQHLPFSLNITARNGFVPVPAAPTQSHCPPHAKDPITRRQCTSLEPNHRPSLLTPSRFFTLQQPPIRVHHFITSKNQINMNQNPLRSFDTSSVMKHIHMVHGMLGMKKRDLVIGASKCKAFNGNENIRGKQTDIHVNAEVSKVNENHLSSRVLAQRAQRKRGCEISSESIKKLKNIPSNSALEQQTGNDTASNTECSEETADKFPSNIALAHARTVPEKDELLVKVKDHLSCEVKNTVERTDMDKIVDASAVNEKQLGKRVLAQRARRERERQELQLKKLNVSHDQTEQHLPFSPIPPNSVLEKQTSNAPSNTKCSQEIVNKCPLNIASTPTRLDTEKDELLMKKKDHSRCEVNNVVEKTDMDKIAGAVTVTERHLRKCVLAQRARREREKKELQLKKLNVSSSTVKNMVTRDQAEQHLPFSPIPSNSTLEQQTSSAPSNTACSQETINKCPSNVALTPTQTDTEKDELLMKKKDHSCCEVKNAVEKLGTDKIVDASTVNEKHLRKAVLAQRARREREKKELQLKKLSVSSSTVKNKVIRDQTEQHIPFSPIFSKYALEQQTSHAPLKTACSQETANKCPSNIALTHARTDTEKVELLVKKKDHLSCEVQNVVEKTDTDKISDAFTVNEMHLGKSVLAQHARREREKKEHQLMKPSVLSSAVKNIVTCDQTKQHLPFLPNIITARNGLTPVPAAPAQSYCPPHEKSSITCQQYTSLEPNHRPSLLNPSRSFALRQPPIRVHHFITSKNQINMKQNPLRSFDTSSVMKHIQMVHGMLGMKKRDLEIGASRCKMDMRKCHMDPPPKPVIRPEDPICLQPRRENLPLLSTPQIHHTGKQSRPENPFVSSTREKVVAAKRKSLTRRQISQRTRREREKAETTQRRHVLLSKRSMAQRARRDRRRQQEAIASSSACSLPAEEQAVGAATAVISSRSTAESSPAQTPFNSTQERSEKPGSQGSNLNILPPNKGVSSQLSSSIPSEHLTSTGCVNSPPQSSVSQGSIVHVLPPNKGVCSGLDSSIAAEHLTRAVVVNSPRQILAGGSTASSVLSVSGPDNLISTDASCPVTISGLERSEVKRLSSPSANMGSGRAFDKGSRIGSVSSQSLGSVPTSFCTTFPSSSLHGPASAASDITKRTLETDESSRTGRITEALLSPMSNEVLLLQLANPCRMVGLTSSSNDGKQWRPDGRSFDSPKSVGAPSVSKSSKGSKTSPVQAQDSKLWILANNNGVCREYRSSVPAEHLASVDIVNPPARSLSGRLTALSFHSGRGPDNLTSVDTSSPINVCSFKKAEVMRVPFPSGNMGIGKGIDRSCKCESVTSLSVNKTHLSPGVEFPGPNSHGPASATSDMVKKTLGTDPGGTGGIMQTPLYTLSNGILLPQLARSCEATGLTNSNSDGKQWRPVGSSFQDPTELVQRRIDSTLGVFGAARSDKSVTSQSKEERNKASGDLKNDNLIVVPSSQGNSILKDRGTVSDATMVSAVDLSVNERLQSPIFNQYCHGENEHLVCNKNISKEELHKSNKKTGCAQHDHQEQPSPQPQAQTDKSNKAFFSSPPMKSLTETPSALNDHENTSGVSHPGGSRKIDAQYWKARFLRLQDHLRQCDDTSDEEYIQRIQCSSSDISGDRTFELKGRAMKLLLEEGYELLRVKHLNVLGNSAVSLSEQLEIEN